MDLIIVCQKSYKMQGWKGTRSTLKSFKDSVKKCEFSFIFGSDKNAFNALSTVIYKSAGENQEFLGPLGTSKA